MHSSRPSIFRPGALRWLGVALLAGPASSCGDVGVAPDRLASVSLSIAVGGEKGQWAVFDDGSHLLTFDRLALVIGDITLGGEGGETLERGPSLLEAPLDGTVRSLVAGIVRPDEYDVLSLQFHAPTAADPNDAAFLLTHPGFEGVSVRVEGRWDGTPFVFERRLDDRRVVDLDELVVEAGRTMNITLLVDPSWWFRAEDGALVDPRSTESDPVAAARVESMIRSSIVAFADQNADGVADPG